MRKKEKELLLADLCARLLYGVKADFKRGQLTRIKHEVEGWYIDKIKDDDFVFIKPYLRPMSSMTEEEIQSYNDIEYCSGVGFYTYPVIDWLNAHHFDYRELIEKGLAIEAPEGMYTKTENK